MHTVFVLLCFVVVIHWLVFPYLSGLLHWHCGNLTIAPVPAKQPWWIWINTSCEFVMNDCITTTKQSTTKPCAYFLGYTVETVVTRVLFLMNWIYPINPYHIPYNAKYSRLLSESWSLWCTDGKWYKWETSSVRHCWGCYRGTLSCPLPWASGLPVAIQW